MALHCNHAMEGVACLWWMDSPGRSARSSRKESPENILSRRGLNMGKGIMVISRMLSHGENDSIGTGSKRQISGLWNHLIWSRE